MPLIVRDEYDDDKYDRGLVRGMRQRHSARVYAKWCRQAFMLASADPTAKVCAVKGDVVVALDPDSPIPDILAPDAGIDFSVAPWVVPKIYPTNAREGRYCGSVPTDIGDLLFRSRRAAAAYFGVTPAAITNAERRGRLHRVGTMGRKEVVIRGVRYASQTEAAESLGLTQGTISSAVKNGTLDGVGLGIGKKGHIPPDMRGQPSRCVELVVRGVRYPSHKAAAEALGVHRATVANAVKKGTLEGLGLGRGRKGHLENAELRTEIAQLKKRLTEMAKARRASG